MAFYHLLSNSLAQAPATDTVWTRIATELSPPYLAILLLLIFACRQFHNHEKEAVAMRRQEMERQEKRDVEYMNMTKDAILFIREASVSLKEQNKSIDGIHAKLDKQETAKSRRTANG